MVATILIPVCIHLLHSLFYVLSSNPVLITSLILGGCRAAWNLLDDDPYLYFFGSSHNILAAV